MAVQLVGMLRPVGLGNLQMRCSYHERVPIRASSATRTTGTQTAGMDDDEITVPAAAKFRRTSTAGPSLPKSYNSAWPTRLKEADEVASFPSTP